MVHVLSLIHPRISINHLLKIRIIGQRLQVHAQSCFIKHW